MPFTEQEVGHYRQVVAKIFSNDPERKTRIDGLARMQLAAVRSALPSADDDTVVTFLVSVAIVVARLLAAPVGDVAELAHGVFNHNMVAAATVMGAYDMDSPGMPVCDEPSSTEAADDSESARAAREVDDILARAYL